MSGKATNPNRRRKEPASTSTDRKKANGWDHPPAIASPATLDDRDENYGSWIPRKCSWKTSQRLFTLGSSKKSILRPDNPEDFMGENLLCAPVVIFNKFILVATDMKLSLYGNFDSQEPYDDTMQRRIDTTAIPPLTEFSLPSDTYDELTDAPSRDKIIQVSFHEETGIVYVLTVKSFLFQVKLVVDDLATKGSSSVTDARNSKGLESNGKGDHSIPPNTTIPRTVHPPRFKLVHNWVGKKLGATCMATLNDGGGVGIDTVFVGFKLGHIEAWNVHQVRVLDSTQAAQHRSRNLPTKEAQGFALYWEGFLHDSIRTLSFLPAHVNTEKGNGEQVEMVETSKIDITDGHKKHDEHYLIIVVSISCRIGEKKKQPPTSSMLRILDLQWITDRMNKTDSNQERISLESFSLPQTIGMEIAEASTASLSKNADLPKRSPILHSNGANMAHILTTTEPDTQENQELSFCTGIAFPDGTTCLFSSSRNTNALGIKEADHQVLLPYPTIGIGQVHITDEHDKYICYLAACLRGGTCYLFPASANKSKNNSNTITTIPFPHEMDSDVAVVYVQSFTAGNIILDGTNFPILVYAWPGGVVDVYACELILPKISDSDYSKIADDAHDVFISRAERRCLQEMIDGDCLSLLSTIFDELKEGSQDSMLQTKEWQNVLKDINDGKILPTSADITLDSLCSNEHYNLRNLLLTLALVEE